jgi:cation diffusion facilitator family transporter
MDSNHTILIRASWISTIGNAILSASKIVIGFFAGSLAVLGDGIDSATDVVISIVMIFTARVMNRPPNKKYVYGYEKAEGIATKVLSLVIFYAGVQMLISSIRSIAHAETKEMPGSLTIWVTLFSIAGKLALSLYQYRQGKKINSSLLKANAANMRNDVIISVGVLVGLAFTFILRLPLLDSVTGLIIGGFILRSAVNIFLDSSIGLMDGVRDTKIYETIFQAVQRVPGAGNPHRVRSRMVGNRYLIVLDIEVDPSITVFQGHEIAEAVERSIRQAEEEVYDIVVHVEPAGRSHADERFGIDYRMIE